MTRGWSLGSVVAGEWVESSALVVGWRWEGVVGGDDGCLGGRRWGEVGGGKIRCQGGRRGRGRGRWSLEATVMAVSL